MKTLITFCFLVFSSYGWAQNSDQGNPYSWGWSWHMGPFLPNQIPGVTEIQPTVGLRFSFPKNIRSATEYSLTSSNANGTSIYNFSVSAKSEFEFDGIYTHVYLGLDAISRRIEQSDLKTEAGGHFGIGMVSRLGGYSHFRMDMKFTVSDPGTSLYLGFGLEMRYPSSGESDSQEEGG